MKNSLGSILILLPGVLFLATWELWVNDNERLRFLFASPSLLWSVGREEIGQAAIWRHVGITVLEAAMGLLLGAVAGTFVGLFLWAHEGMARMARPYVVLMGAIPIFAIAPMLVIWFGTGLLSKIIMAAFAVFFVSLAQAYDGAALAYAEHGHYARSLGTPYRRTLTKIVIPGALRWVTAGLKISIGLALVGAFIGEFVSSQAGLGHYILSAGSLYDMPRVLFGVLLVGVIALGMTGLVRLVERWKPHYFVVK